MKLTKNPGEISLGARFVGLGLSTAVALTIVGALPSNAIAEEDGSTDAGSTDGNAVVVANDTSSEETVTVEVKGASLSTTAPIAVQDDGAVNADVSNEAGSSTTADITPQENAESDTQENEISTDQVVGTTDTTQQTDENQADSTEAPNDTTETGAAEVQLSSSDSIGIETPQAVSDGETVTTQTQTVDKSGGDVTATTTAGTTNSSASKAKSVAVASASAKTTTTVTTAVNPVISSSDVLKAETIIVSATETDSDETPEITYYNMYRLYNPYSGEHFYTSNLEEAKTNVVIGWQWENVGWVAPSVGTAVYRLYNPYTGDHHYTSDTNEKNTLVSVGWNYEGIGWYSDATTDGVAVLRQFNPYEQIGTHNYTTSSSERSYLVSIGWRDEGVGWYASNHATVDLGEGFWIVTSAWGSLQRYWIGSDGVLAYNRRIDSSVNPVDAGAGYVAFASTNYAGAVVRGAWVHSSGYVYVADNDGKLVEYSDAKFHDLDLGLGEGTQSYYFDSTGSGKSGLFTVDGKTYYAVPDQGYILKNQPSVSIGDKFYSIDENGVVSELEITPEIQAALTYANSITNQYGMFRDLFITVSHNTHTLYVWQGSRGNLSYLWSTSCTMGKPSTPTQYGYNYLNDPQEYFSGARYAVKYAGHEYGDGWHIHSVLTSNDELGKDISNGCIRIPVDKAKWIYDKVTNGYGGWGWSTGINLYVY